MKTKTQNFNRIPSNVDVIGNGGKNMNQSTRERATITRVLKLVMSAHRKIACKSSAGISFRCLPKCNLAVLCNKTNN